jgi:hypothetical protein
MNMRALSWMICMVGWVVFMPVSRLHSYNVIWISGKLSGLYIYLVFFYCGW